MPPSPDRIAFFRENKADIDSMVRAENVRRSRRSLVALNDDEIDDAIGQMMSIIKGGGRIRQFKFPSTGVPITPAEVSQNLAVLAPQQPRPITPLPITGKRVAGDVFQFEVVKCANGFLLSQTKSGELKTFIFKTPEDLMDIFKDGLFKEITNVRRSDDPVREPAVSLAGSGAELAGKPDFGLGEQDQIHGNGRSVDVGDSAANSGNSVHGQ